MYKIIDSVLKKSRCEGNHLTITGIIKNRGLLALLPGQAWVALRFYALRGDGQFNGYYCPFIDLALQFNFTAMPLNDPVGYG